MAVAAGLVTPWSEKLAEIAMRPTEPHGLSIWLSVALALITGTLAGAANGFFIARIRVHPLIVTLATLGVLIGGVAILFLRNPVFDLRMVTESDAESDANSDTDAITDTDANSDSDANSNS